MALPDIKDVGILAGFVMWGNPWHGTVKGGVLNTGKIDVLGSAITRAWTQPPNAFIWLSEKDGQPADAYSATQAAMKAAHAADGMEFKPWALISGGQVYGQQVGVNKWFYYAGDQVWLVTLTYPASVTNTGPITVQISAQAWPEFTTAPHSPAIVRNITLADIGQAAPDLSALGVSATLQVSLHDVKPNGSACILSLHTTSTVDNVIPPALGFVLVELSSDIDNVFDAVNVSVLKTREQTLGTIQDDNYYDIWGCELVPVWGVYLGVNRVSWDRGKMSVVNNRIVTAYFNESSGAIEYGHVKYENGYNWGGAGSIIIEITYIDNALVEWKVVWTTPPIKRVDRLVYYGGGTSFDVYNNNYTEGAFSYTEDGPYGANRSDVEFNSAGDVEGYALNQCYTSQTPKSTSLVDDPVTLRLRVKGGMTIDTRCRYPNISGPVVVVGSLIGTPNGIVQASDLWLASHEPGLGVADDFYVAYHPKTGEVVPFLANPVSFV